jgi:sterol desaturase/sphingolipid hydroxylase (fatty acid hydroxylase superfamily)
MLRTPDVVVALAGWLVFPAIVGGTFGAAIALEPRVGAAAALIIAKFSALVAIVAAERLLPYRHEWNHSHGDLATDIAHGVISGLGTTTLLRLGVQAGGVVLAGALSQAFGSMLWPTTWPLLAQLALAAVVAELPMYWLHRWQHEHDALWRFHAVHHSAPRLYWLNGARNHPVDLGLTYLVGYLPLIALGASEAVIMLFTLFDPVLGTLQHSNIAMRLGPLNYVFSASEPHRWHHSRTLIEANSNYGSNLLIWDVVFGTFFLPRDRAPAGIGIADMPDFPQTFAAQMATPFRAWHRLARAPT